MTTGTRKSCQPGAIDGLAPQRARSGQEHTDDHPSQDRRHDVLDAHGS